MTTPATMTDHPGTAADRTIEGADNSASLVFERMGGTLPKGNPVAAAAGIDSISGMSGFDRKGFSWQHRFPGIWTVAALESGEGTLECEGRKIAITAGSVYIIPPGLPFRETNTEDGFWKFVCLLFRFHDETILGGISANLPLLLDNSFDLTIKIQEVVRSLHFREPGFEWRVSGGAIAILGEIIRRLDTRGDSALSPTIAKAVESLRRNLIAPPSIKELAKNCMVSVSLLSHQFKKETGFSPMEYSRRERIKAVKELMLAGTTVEEAASKLGFKTPFHLSRMFSDLEGRPPSYFRKLAKRS